ncbi:MAG: hypothetical protein ABI972_28995, partial [Acidobacteriota bacterium]
MTLSRAALPLTLLTTCILAQTPAPEYKIYAGSTHAHTSYTWSHGAHLNTNNCAGIMVYAPEKDSPSVSSWAQGYKKGEGCPGI